MCCLFECIGLNLFPSKNQTGEKRNEQNQSYNLWACLNCPRVALGFNTMKDDPKKGNPMDSRNNESINPIQQDGPRLPVGGYDTDGTPYYTDNFDGANDTTSLKTRGYFVWYRGAGPQGLTATWFQGNDVVFSAFNGPTTGYVAANYNVVTSANNIDSWLITLLTTWPLVIHWYSTAVQLLPTHSRIQSG